MDRQRIVDQLNQMNEELERIMGDLDGFLQGAGVENDRIENIGRIIDYAFNEIGGGLRDAGYPVIRVEEVVESEDEEEETEVEESLDLLGDEDLEEEEEEEDPLTMHHNNSPPRVHWTDGEVFLRAQEDLDEPIISPRRLSWRSDVTVNILTHTPASIRDWEWYFDRLNVMDDGEETDNDTWVDDTWVPSMASP